MEEPGRARARRRFCRFSTRAAELLGSPQAFTITVVGLLIWALTGPFCHFSDTWQLWINTVTNVVCLVMVFLIQNTQNRDSRAINLKLDELIRSKKKARSELIGIEGLTDEELAEIGRQSHALHAAASSGNGSAAHIAQGSSGDGQKQERIVQPRIVQR